MTETNSHPQIPNHAALQRGLRWIVLGMKILFPSYSLDRIELELEEPSTSGSAAGQLVMG
jgi:hypothetical protein